ncbi:hypothetical protein N7532_001931 [Penicillium argentinense]|uniref:Uncharacterized protein n=1 Tax=Penicillium argentinense TaxID=1131581 RepID=A0A9W9G3P7_9EURO|nr:uncharacterized protein N7532_001931 [Penicillium argentinense]KAJ5111396.1 hypothetical protein N7532_001931 [Penicillium argentinense]
MASSAEIVEGVPTPVLRLLPPVTLLHNFELQRQNQHMVHFISQLQEQHQLSDHLTANITHAFRLALRRDLDTLIKFGTLIKDQLRGREVLADHFNAWAEAAAALRRLGFSRPSQIPTEASVLEQQLRRCVLNHMKYGFQHLYNEYNGQHDQIIDTVYKALEKRFGSTLVNETVRELREANNLVDLSEVHRLLLPKALHESFRTREAPVSTSPSLGMDQRMPRYPKNKKAAVPLNCPVDLYEQLSVVMKQGGIPIADYFAIASHVCRIKQQTHPGTEMAIIDAFIAGIDNELYRRRMVHWLRKGRWNWEAVSQYVEILSREEIYLANQEYALQHQLEDGSVLLPNGSRSYRFTFLPPINDEDLTSSDEE